MARLDKLVEGRIIAKGDYIFDDPTFTVLRSGNRQCNPVIFILPACRGIPARLQGHSKSSVKYIQCHTEIPVRVQTVKLTLICPNSMRRIPKVFNNPDDELPKFKDQWRDTACFPVVTGPTTRLTRTMAAPSDKLIDRIDWNPTLQ